MEDGRGETRHNESRLQRQAERGGAGQCTSHSRPRSRRSISCVCICVYAYPYMRVCGCACVLAMYMLHTAIEMRSRRAAAFATNIAKPAGGRV